jgi:hypothetical protein
METPEKKAESEEPSKSPKKTIAKKKTSKPSPKTPKITRRIKKEIELSLRKLKGITSHIRNVQDNCIVLGEKLIERGEVNLGREIIARSFIHDNSKFYGIEWDHMAPGTEITDSGVKIKLKLAISHHNRTNPHHPEFWEKIQNMPKIAIAEFVCDTKARSQEFGTDFRAWIDNIATKKWQFTKEDLVYKQIMEFVDMVCEKPFEKI